LALCGRQDRAGRNKDFRYTIPEIAQATGLKKRIISAALKDIEKLQLIERLERPGPVGNLYRVVWEPTPATADKPVSEDTEVPPEPEVADVVASEAPPANQGGQAPLRESDSSEPPATTPAGEPGDPGAGGRENQEPEAQPRTMPNGPRQPSRSLVRQHDLDIRATGRADRSGGGYWPGSNDDPGRAEGRR